MNKKIIPAEASFFVPVEKVLFDHSKMRKTLETAAAGGAKTRSRASSEYVLYSHGAPAAE